MPYTQANRHLAITTEAGPDALLLQAFTGHEWISRPFQFNLDLLAEVSKPVDPNKVLGKNASIAIRTTEGTRYIHGCISQFFEGGSDNDFIYYRAELVPHFWLLSLKADCRIFQNIAIGDLIQELLKGLPTKYLLLPPLPVREYCVQYRETTLNFVSRIMEQYGIRYFFTSDAGGYEQMISSSPRNPSTPLQAKARFERGALPVGGKQSVVTDWRIARQLRPHKFGLKDYNFENPSLNLGASVEAPAPLLPSKPEVFDYPGEYSKFEDGRLLVGLRMQESEAQRMTISGSSTCAGFTAGHQFMLSGHPRHDDEEYLLTAVHHVAHEADYRSGQGAAYDYVNNFECVPVTVGAYRPPRMTPRPFVQGTQPAKVVGDPGAEIHCDKYARVKVHFYWDRHGKEDDTSSCWIRVSTAWAGQGWGSISIPRVGQEVIVDYLEGDPDQPIIIGRVYNAEQMPPQALPAGKTVSGLKSQTHQGSGYNEISMDDTAGKERIVVHGQYDMTSTIEHDVTGDIGNNETLSVAKDRMRSVGGNESVTVSKKRSRSVGLSEEIDITEGQTISIGKKQEVSITDAQTISIGKGQTLSVKQNRKTEVGADDALSVAKKLMVDAGDEITFKAGKATLTLKKDGTIKISGKDISLDGTGKITGKAAKDVVLKGSKVAQN